MLSIRPAGFFRIGWGVDSEKYGLKQCVPNFQDLLEDSMKPFCPYARYQSRRGLRRPLTAGPSLNYYIETCTKMHKCQPD